MKMSSDTIINMYYYERKVTPKKRGPDFRINNYHKLRIKRQVAQLKKEEEKINAPKIKKSCYLQISTRTIQRNSKCEGYKYVKAKSQIILSKKHKEAMLEIITN